MGNSIIENQIDQQWFKVDWHGYTFYWQMMTAKWIVPESFRVFVQSGGRPIKYRSLLNEGNHGS